MILNHNEESFDTLINGYNEEKSFSDSISCDEDEMKTLSFKTLKYLFEFS
jgi:hypothetical protein